jgi:hypothetical protein
VTGAWVLAAVWTVLLLAFALAVGYAIGYKRGLTKGWSDARDVWRLPTPTSKERHS